MTTTFETAKVGDRVWCMRSGWGEIRSISSSKSYPLAVYFTNEEYKTYTTEGLHDEEDLSRTLFWDEVVIKAPVKPMPVFQVDTKVIVWDSSTPKTKRYFSHFSSSGEMMCFIYGMTSWTTTVTSGWDSWELA